MFRSMSFGLLTMVVWLAALLEIAAQPLEVGENKARTAVIEARLHELVSLDMKDMPFRQAIKEIGVITGLEIVIDVEPVDNERVDKLPPVSLAVERIPVASALNQILRQANLAHVIRDGVLCITTPEGLRGKLVQKSHPIEFFVTTLHYSATGARAIADAKLGEEMVSNVTEVIQPESWRGAGGKATIKYSPENKSLIVNHYEEQQEQIADLLNCYRKEADSGNVVLETRFVTVLPSVLATFCDPLKIEEIAGRTGKVVSVEKANDIIQAKVADMFIPQVQSWPLGHKMPPIEELPCAPKIILDDQQVSKLLELATDHPSTRLTQIPPVVVRNEQHVLFDFAVKKSATRAAEVPHDDVQPGKMAQNIPVDVGVPRFRVVPSMHYPEAVFIHFQLAEDAFPGLKPGPTWREDTPKSTKATQDQNSTGKPKTTQSDLRRLIQSVPTGKTVVLVMGHLPANSASKAVAPLSTGPDQAKPAPAKLTQENPVLLVLLKPRIVGKAGEPNSPKK